MFKLIQEDVVQANWKLIINVPAPSIAEYNRAPAKYENHLMVHGFYDIEVNSNDIWETDNGFRVRFKEGLKNNTVSVKVHVSRVLMLKHLALGNLRYNDYMLYIRGRFVKRGAEILFELSDS
ncbi:hypothetical protein YenMTG1_236 [Yersinia phage vB_YenM_TG1]|uniref:Uncharacterized protein n=1 Tax=Yersinia phage vB_YenM_TG1 TaxID=1589265 RepID=A0A0B5A4P8_9CAUD|nr:hypothetical protein AVV33_gp159 [Yersinia phage vB_YenM_TG1]AJD82046.1 hypothetical protein YenMTG1_236 [Yersinia phage vB_YenM_TG1]